MCVLVSKGKQFNIGQTYKMSLGQTLKKFVKLIMKNVFKNTVSMVFHYFQIFFKNLYEVIIAYKKETTIMVRRKKAEVIFSLFESSPGTE